MPHARALCPVLPIPMRRCFHNVAEIDEAAAVNSVKEPEGGRRSRRRQRDDRSEALSCLFNLFFFLLTLTFLFFLDPLSTLPRKKLGKKTVYRRRAPLRSAQLRAAARRPRARGELLTLFCPLFSKDLFLTFLLLLACGRGLTLSLSLFLSTSRPFPTN